MPHVLPSRTRPARNYAAVAAFLVVYLGVLVFVFAPKDMIAVQSPTALLATD
jgi:cbb3-type cytochrome oxidase subunit 3